MGVVATIEFDLGDFVFRPFLTGSPYEIEFERMIPSEEVIIPFVWVKNVSDRDEIRLLEREERIAGFRVVDEIESSVLCRTVWRENPDLLNYAQRCEAIVRSARGTSDGWLFEIQFPSRTKLSTFGTYVGRTTFGSRRSASRRSPTSR